MVDNKKDLLRSRRSPLRAALFGVANTILYTLEWFIAKSSKVSTTPFLPKEEFPWVPQMEAAAPKIREEVLALLETKQYLPNFQEISKDQDQLTQDDDWKTVFFEAYGITSEANRKRCPHTAAAIDQVPGMKLAMLSMFSGKKHVPAHRGPYKGVIRYHLGLVVPEPAGAARIRVGNETRAWAEGESLVFDDSYNHEAWNDADGDRVVLFLDVVRPCRFPFNLLNKLIIAVIARSPFVRDLERNQRAWEERYEQAVAARAS
jgi:aspartyl/asparaginyl beta-hydroxylase (cupin superfamily)